MPLQDASASLVGSATVVATAGLTISVGGTSAGAGAGSFGPGHEIHYAATSLAGVSSLTGAVGHVLIFTGRAQGVGSFVDGLLMSATGTAVGAGSATGSLSHMISLSGSAHGQGIFNISLPELLVGIGTLAGFLEILHVPPPVCGPVCGCGSCCGRREERCQECHEWHRKFHHREPWWWQCRECWERHAWHRREEEHEHRDEHGHKWTREPNRPMGEFRWNQILGKGDLEICLQDRQGNQRGPVFIAYTMFMVTPTGVLHQTGPTDRKPAQADVGKFYVTGTAGENGQPGCWAVRWRYQRTYGDPITERLVQFRVLDAVLDCDRRDHVHRHCKYGWDL